MIRLQLRIEYAAAPWDWQQDAWSTHGGGRIEPFPNDALESVAYTDGENSFFVVRERRRGVASRGPGPHHVSPRDYQSFVAEALSWSLDFFAVEATGLEFRLHAGLWGTAPVYVAVRDGTVVGSWSPVDLRTHLTLDQLDQVAVVRHLAGLHQYSACTLFRGVRHLTERSMTRFTAAGLKVSYPPPAPHAAPRDLHPDADVHLAYDRILHEAVERRQLPWDRLAVEVSGGLDSAIVALTAAQLANRPMLSYGLLIGGQAGEQQRQRRTALIKFVGLRDHTIDAMALAPLCPEGRRVRGAAFWPFDEPYSEALDAALARIRAAGATIVLTGIGGDELTSLRPFERGNRTTRRSTTNVGLLTAAGRELLELPPEEAPAPVIPEPGLLAFACRSPVFLRAGCWPVSPLCEPNLIRFCEWLPADWRRGRRLHRERLIRLGLPDKWVRPPLRENFTHVMEHAMRRHGRRLLDAVLDDPVLAQLGLIDPDAIARYRNLRPAGTAATPELYELLNIELSLQRLLAES